MLDQAEIWTMRKPSIEDYAGLKNSLFKIFGSLSDTPGPEHQGVALTTRGVALTTNKESPSGPRQSQELGKEGLR